jgi:hypothetical protein
MDEFLSSKEMDYELERIAKAEKIEKSVVKKVCRLVQMEDKKSNGIRKKKIVGPITIQSIACKYVLTESEVVFMAKEQSKFEKPTVQKVIESKLYVSPKIDNLSLF